MYKYVFLNLKTQREAIEEILEECPKDGEKIEAGGNVFYVCVTDYAPQLRSKSLIGVLPEKVPDPGSIRDIERCIGHLKIGGRHIKYRNAAGECDFEFCTEMIIF